MRNTAVNIEQLILDGALFVANHSGGKDSQAMLIEMAKRIPASQILVIHATLGDVEWPGALELAQKQAQDLGAAFRVARARWADGSEKTFLGLAERRYAARPEVPSFPSAKHRQCTSDLKRDPIEREIRAFVKQSGHTLIVNCMGLRAAESTERRKLQTWKPHVELSKAGRTAWSWLPIHQLTTAQVFETIRAAGQEPHWAYAQGNERLSCVFCIMARDSDIQNGARLNPELFQRYVELEQRTGYAMHQSQRTLTEIVAAVAAEQLPLAA